MKKVLFPPILICFLTLAAFGQNQKKTQIKPISWTDVPSWRFISSSGVEMSPDGKWLAYTLQKVEGDSEVIVLKSDDPENKRIFPIGASNNPAMSFSNDSKWLAFKESPAEKEKKANDKRRVKSLADKLILIELDTTNVTQFERVNNFSFNGEAASHLAISLHKEDSNDNAKGADLLLVHLVSGKLQNIGNVLEFSFNKSGKFLAYSIGAANQSGNGINLMDVTSGNTQVIDSESATYKSINWTEKGDAFAALKMVKDRNYKQDKGKVLGVKDLENPQLTFYDPEKDSLNFPQNLTISPNRIPMWSEDLSRLFFGVSVLEVSEKEDKKENDEVDKDSLEASDAEKLAQIKSDTTIKSMAELQNAIAKLDSSNPKQKAPEDDLTKPEMTIWHWQDSRLQSRQKVLENQDKNYNLWAMYDVAESKHHMLQDSSMKELMVLPKEKFALGSDFQAYELDMNLNGQNYRDFYVVDLQTGDRTPLLERFYLPNYSSFPKPSPDGTKLLFGQDGHFYVFDLEKGSKTNLTEKIPNSFIDNEDDHNIEKPLNSPMGWSSDNNYVLLRDNWDIWQVPINPKEKAVNLTENGRKEKIRYQYRFVLDEEEKGIDLKKTQFFRIYGERTKKSGIVKIESDNSKLISGAKTLIWEDANIGRLAKAKSSESYLFSKEKFNQSTEYYLADSTFSPENSIIKNTPDAPKYKWSSGVKLIDYISDKGDSLQGALFLPADFQEGKQYPTIVYYYEKLSQTLHSYSQPGFSGTGWNPNVYTSNGYAVFVPDIVYQLDDPGMSAVWCVLPAVKAAIETGVIDEKNIGIHGHSWGGYQTSFLITQTDMFKAAAAGAPLTNMISMYDLIYWNSGGGNMSIFEASQGRFKGAPWENWDAYLRNSPVYHVKNVNTPLLMLHNDKDGAVDFTQGIEYYSALRRLKKPVILVQYQGENHGLSKLENRKDYSVRMMEFFDHHLKGNPAPEWMTSGVDMLKLDDHLKERAF